MSPEMQRLFAKTKLGQEIIYPDDLCSYDSDIYSLGILVYELSQPIT